MGLVRPLAALAAGAALPACAALLAAGPALAAGGPSSPPPPRPPAKAGRVAFEAASELGDPADVLSRGPEQNRRLVRRLPRDRRAALEAEVARGPRGHRRVGIHRAAAFAGVGAAPLPITARPAASGGVLADRELADRLMFATPLPDFISFRTWNHAEIAFDWTTDLCSTPWFVKPISRRYERSFSDACVRHDFGYDNYGPRSRLRLDPTPAGRSRIDDVFYADLRTIAEAQDDPVARFDLELGAVAFYRGVRVAGAAFY